MHRTLVLLGTGAMALPVQMLSFATLAQAAGDPMSSGVGARIDGMSELLGGLLGIAFIYVVIIRPFLKRKKNK